MPKLTNQNLDKIKDKIIDIALFASNTIMQNLGSTVKIKNDGSPVTTADIKSDQIITEKLSSIFTNFPIVLMYSNKVKISQLNKT